LSRSPTRSLCRFSNQYRKISAAEAAELLHCSSLVDDLTKNVQRLSLFWQ